jgi:ribonucleoside-diphosphate reductase alpha chain
MLAVENDEEWALKSPKDNHVVDRVKARDLWIRLLTARIETASRTFIYIDHVNDQIPDHHKMAGLNVKMSNLCSEITLPTGKDHLGNDRTAVCCLSSLNLETFDQWQDHPTFIEDIMRFLDNVLTDFINKAPDSMKRAKYAAMRERSVGLGVMGFHSFLQSKMIPMEGVMAKVWNRRMFQHIKRQADDASVKLAHERGACPDAADYGIMERFSNKMAIAPTASISIICGGASARHRAECGQCLHAQNTVRLVRGEEPVSRKTARGKRTEYEDVWSSIFTNEGSVQHLDFLSQEKKTCSRPRSKSTSAG